MDHRLVYVMTNHDLVDLLQQILLHHQIFQSNVEQDNENFYSYLTNHVMLKSLFLLVPFLSCHRRPLLFGLVVCRNNVDPSRSCHQRESD